MKQVKKIFVGFVALALIACDPAHIVRMDAVTTTATVSSIPVIISDVASRNKMESYKESKTNKGRVSYWRGWGNVQDGHPNSIYLSAEQGSLPNLWNVEILEWLVFTQSEFGKGLQIDITEALEENGYEVSVGK